MTAQEAVNVYRMALGNNDGLKLLSVIFFSWVHPLISHRILCARPCWSVRHTRRRRGRHGVNLRRAPARRRHQAASGAGAGRGRTGPAPLHRLIHLREACHALLEAGDSNQADSGGHTAPISRRKSAPQRLNHAAGARGRCQTTIHE